MDKKVEIKYVLMAFGLGLAIGFGLSFLPWSQWFDINQTNDLVLEDENKGEVFSITDVKSNEADALEEEDKGEDECVSWIDVSGAVHSPGVYCLSENQILNDAVKAAGGIYNEVYAFKFVSQHINLAKQVSNGEKLYVPFKDDVVCKRKEDWDEDPSEVNDPLDVVSDNSSGGESKADSDLGSAVCVSINNASKTELEGLDGVGPSTADKIIKGRPYAKVDDLLDVSGIGQATLDKIEDDLCI